MNPEKRDDVARRGHAILKDSPAATQAKFEAAIDAADDLVLDEASDGVYFIYETGVATDDGEGDA